MVNLDNLEKVIGKRVCIVLKYGNELSVSGKLLRLEENDIIVECDENYRYGYAGANVRDGEAHVPVSALAMWFLVKVYE